MKNFLKNGFPLLIIIILIASCQPNNTLSDKKSKVESFTFYDNVIHGDFKILDINKNNVLGELVLINKGTGTVSFPFGNIVFQNKDQKGKVFQQSDRTLAIQKKNTHENINSDMEQRKKSELKEKLMKEIHADLVSRSVIKLKENKEKTMIVRVEFDNEVGKLENVRIMLKGIYKQLLSTL